MNGHTRVTVYPRQNLDTSMNLNFSFSDICNQVPIRVVRSAYCGGRCLRDAKKKQTMKDIYKIRMPHISGSFCKIRSAARGSTMCPNCDSALVWKSEREV